MPFASYARDFGKCRKRHHDGSLEVLPDPCTVCQQPPLEVLESPVIKMQTFSMRVSGIRPIEGQESLAPTKPFAA